MLCPLQGEDFFARRSRHHQRIDLAAANCIERFFSFLKTLAKLVEFQPHRGLLISLHFDLPAIARPSSTLGRSDRSPIMRFVGGGSSLIRVGAAMMSDSVARPGSW